MQEQEWPSTTQMSTPPEPATWQEEDEVRLLRAALEMAAEPAEAFDPTVSPLDRMGSALANKRFGREDILAKVKELRRKHQEKCCRLAQTTVATADDGGSPARSQQLLEISQRIWGCVHTKNKNAKGKGNGKGRKKKRARFWLYQKDEEFEA